MTLAATLTLVALSGCATRNPSGAVQTSPEAAWQVFRQQYCTPSKKPGLLVKASLSYSRPKPIKRSNRTVISMWGNFSGPMRLDISAGIGKLLAHIREDTNGLLVFYPSDKVAYTHTNPVLGATRLGMPFPFSLNELANIVNGDFSGLVPNEYAEPGLQNSDFSYQFSNGLVSRLVLNETGRPILLEGRTTKAYETAQAWRLEINTYKEAVDKSAPLPEKLTLALDNGEKGVLRIKARELKVAPWPAKATDLKLPKNVKTIRLDNRHSPSRNQDMPVVYTD
ncbi:MAG: hypothetical protein JEY79_18870 [Pseudodesulfovibrio sp.]|nr:hypothetical protein [Pseudodesulfovibrio sp.]